MKSAEEWWNLLHSPSSRIGCNVSLQEIRDIQSDAFHAGKLEGMQEAREIVKNYGTPMVESGEEL